MNFGGHKASDNSLLPEAKPTYCHYPQGPTQPGDWPSPLLHSGLRSPSWLHFLSFHPYSPLHLSLLWNVSSRRVVPIPGPIARGPWGLQAQLVETGLPSPSPTPWPPTLHQEGTTGEQRQHWNREMPGNAFSVHSLSHSCQE